MPRGRPKGSKNLNAYERGKVKHIREILTQKGITDFDNLRDAQIRYNIHLDTDSGIFVNYKIFWNPAREKILNKMEKYLEGLREKL
jgi:hypothetical protein